jgi:protein involved in polysaccharide export with SLBB domain
MTKMSLPPYVIEPPDILLIDAVQVIPLPPYRVAPLDHLFIQSSEKLPDEPIGGIYPVGPDGTVNLGPAYGSVRVAGLTLAEARAALEKHLGQIVKNPKVTVAVAQSRGLQQIRGEHLVGPDGMVRLGIYGSVHVAGLTVPQAKAAIEAHLSQFLQKPEISLDVFAYNSKVYYVIFDGGGFGEQVIRLPIAGNETVLDAIGQVPVRGFVEEDLDQTPGP